MTSSVFEAEPVEKKFSGKVVKLIKGDLTDLPVDAFVFYAREDLDPGSGYGTAIQVRAGAAVKKELEKIGSIKMGEAVATTGGEMKAKFIIHACGPKHLESDTESKLHAICPGASQRLPPPFARFLYSSIEGVEVYYYILQRRKAREVEFSGVAPGCQSLGYRTSGE